MKHYIIGKFKPDVIDKAALCSRIAAMFAGAMQIEGVHGAKVYPNCIARDNRYDVMIVLDLDQDALPAWDASTLHHQWKNDFGELLEKKAIFDHE